MFEKGAWTKRFVKYWQIYSIHPLGHRYLKCCLSSFSSAYVSMWHAVIIDYLLYFHLLYFRYKRCCKQVNSGTNSFLPAPFERLETKKYLSVTFCSCARIIHDTRSILVKILRLVSSSFTC